MTAPAEEESFASVSAMRADWIADNLAAHTHLGGIQQPYDRVCPCGSGVVVTWMTVRAGSGDQARVVAPRCERCPL